ncbi:creatininase family protein [Autumnicola edwardsiae]|uniref:Creatininase family protein n=1 Tax=Autumnicola edwardsiae TaxID=3075594 RepID=A0ABU3CZ98_9FLAO|nr:creatininase family protein [Zunongwangia sp. F297]MDT0651693.1 creatininase family protein [Zunongwangia sp. F297]
MYQKIKWGFYNEMRPKEIEAILKKRPIAFLPWGAIEYHGKHNPVGLDSIKALNLCTDVAKETGGIVMPVVDLAANLIKSYPGISFKKHSIEFSEKLIYMICEEYLDQLADQDFKIVILLSGHAGEPHLQNLKTVAENFNKKNKSKHCWALAEFDVLPKDLLVANHSALEETSLQLYYAKEMVDLKSLPQDREISLELDAVSGRDPRSASVSYGEKIAKTFVHNVSKKIQLLINSFC